MVAVAPSGTMMTGQRTSRGNRAASELPRGKRAPSPSTPITIIRASSLAEIAWSVWAGGSACGVGPHDEQPVAEAVGELPGEVGGHARLLGAVDAGDDRRASVRRIADGSRAVQGHAVRHDHHGTARRPERAPAKRFQGAPRRVGRGRGSPPRSRLRPCRRLPRPGGSRRRRSRGARPRPPSGAGPPSRAGGSRGPRPLLRWRAHSRCDLEFSGGTSSRTWVSTTRAPRSAASSPPTRATRSARRCSTPMTIVGAKVHPFDVVPGSWQGRRHSRMGRKPHLGEREDPSTAGSTGAARMRASTHGQARPPQRSLSNAVSQTTPDAHAVASALPATRRRRVRVERQG